MGRFLLRLAVLAGIIGLVAKLVPGIHIVGSNWWLFWLALLLSLVNAIVGTVIKLLSLPLILLTLGLFLLVCNAVVLAVTAGLSSHLNVDNFASAVVGALFITLFSWLAELVLPISNKRGPGRKRDRGHEVYVIDV